MANRKAVASVVVGRERTPDAGPIVYPCGVWDPSQTYVRNDKTVPMVMYGDDAATAQYYYLGRVGSFKGVNPKSDYATNGAKATWLLIERYRAAFFEIVFANFALIAGSVFHNNRLFSQYGTDKNGNATDQYQNIVDGSFVPNLLIEWIRGRFVCNDAEIRGVIDAIGGRIGNFKIVNGSLTNYDSSATGKPFYGDAYMILRNDLNKTFAGIGTNISSSTSDSTVVARAENNTLRSDGDMKTNIGINVSASGSRIANHAINIEAGDIAGFAINVLKIKTDVTLTNSDVYISCYNSTDIVITIPIPSAATVGKVYYIKRINEQTVTVKTAYGSYIFADKVIPNVTHVSRGDTMMLVNDGQYWLYNYLPV